MECDVDISSGVLDLVSSVDRGLMLVVDDVSSQLSATSTTCSSIYLSPALLPPFIIITCLVSHKVLAWL